MTPAAQFLPGLYVCVCSMSQLINVIRRLNIVEEMTNNRLRSVELKKQHKWANLMNVVKKSFRQRDKGQAGLPLQNLCNLPKWVS